MAVTLPTPLVTAHIDARGNVTIDGERPPVRQRSREPVMCTACQRRGHNRSNRRCPARAA